MEQYWLAITFTAAIIVLLLIRARGAGKYKERQIRRTLGLSANARLTPHHLEAFRAFEDTDIRLRKTFPNISDRQRRAITRNILCDKGLLSKSARRAT